MNKALFGEFPPITDEQWQQQVLKDLKGAAPETLEWESAEGVTIKPYYRISNKPALQVPVRPVGPWLIRQDIVVDDEKTANAEALDALQRGAMALHFVCNGNVKIEPLLKDVLLQHIHTSWQVDNEGTLNGLAATLRARGLALDSVQGSIQYSAPDSVVYYQRYQESLPGFKLFTIPPANADTLTEQTAQQLAQANGFVLSLVNSGLPATEALGQIGFDIEIGTDHFFEIVRIRVLRALWMVVCRQYVPDYAIPAFIHTSNKKVAPEKDGYYEMIRQTTQALSAVLGGADSISLTPHVATPDRGLSFQTRIARNVQLILQHESHLDAVADPAAGSWYLEELTSQLVEKAWQRFVLLTQSE